MKWAGIGELVVAAVGVLPGRIGRGRQRHRVAQGQRAPELGAERHGERQPAAALVGLDQQGLGDRVQFFAEGLGQVVGGEGQDLGTHGLCGDDAAEAAGGFIQPGDRGIHPGWSTNGG